MSIDLDYDLIEKYLCGPIDDEEPMEKVIDIGIEDTKIPLQIFISGKKRHGKDLFVAQLRTQFLNLENGKFTFGDSEERYRVKGIRMSRIAFADPIKQFAKQAFGLDEDQVNGATKFKEAPIPFWNGLTPREIMQKIGSYLREIDEDVFAKSLITRLKHRRETAKRNSAHRNKVLHHMFLNSDTRYPNEITVTRKHLKKSAYIRIVREGMAPTPFDNHPSETSLDDYDKWDAVIMNDMDIPSLRAKANALVAGWVGINANYRKGIQL